MSGHEIDWVAAWGRAKAERPRRKDATFWNDRAPSFSRHASESDYQKQFLDLMQPQPSWSVLDVGCGSGTLAVPLAGRIRSVTALDFSPGMLALLQERCRKEELANVTPILGSWEDDWQDLGIGSFDVAISSRSIVVDDLRAALVKLDRAAKRRVYISAMVGDGPNDRRIFNAVGRELRRGPDYIYGYNLLHQMEIYAEVSFITCSEWLNYRDRDAALEGMRWMLDDLDAKEETRLRDYLAAELVPHGAHWRLPAPKVVRWAVINWKKEA